LAESVSLPLSPPPDPPLSSLCSGWADAIARKKVGDLKTFESLLLEPLQADLVRDTWLYERYDSQGQQIRTAFYFEYPSLVAMMLTEIRYGLEMSLQTITVNPFQTETALALGYSFSFGSLLVEYAPSSPVTDSSSAVVTLRFPGSGHVRDFAVHHLRPSASYDVVGQGASADCLSLTQRQLVVEETGRLLFSSPVFSTCTLVLSLSPPVATVA
jgi:hypothetical protein